MTGPEFVVACDRLEQDLFALAEVGRVGETGVSRLAYTPTELQAREHLAAWFEEAGLGWETDAFGNMIARRPGADPQLPPVAAGSHIDSPPLGGCYDGVVGVLAALAALRAMNTAGLQTQHPLELIVFACEEPGRFGVSCLGSKVMAGKFDPTLLDRLHDRDGVSLRAALQQAGFDPDGVPDARRRQGELDCYLELHVEQGRVLEEKGIPLGVVTSIAGPTRAQVRVQGVADHSGATPMQLRRDALTAAAEAILKLEELARADRRHGTVATVGVLEVKPGALNIVPGEARFSVDIRGNDHGAKRRVIEDFFSALQTVAEKRAVHMDWEISVDEPPVPLSERLITELVGVCESLRVPYHVMPSGAGHDAQHMAAITDAGMLFVPSRDGISHAPEEFTEMADICRGAQVLAHALVKLAGLAERTAM